MNGREFLERSARSKPVVGFMSSVVLLVFMVPQPASSGVPAACGAPSGSRTRTQRLAELSGWYASPDRQAVPQAVASAAPLPPTAKPAERPRPKQWAFRAGRVFLIWKKRPTKPNWKPVAELRWRCPKTARWVYRAACTDDAQLAEVRRAELERRLRLDPHAGDAKSADLWKEPLDIEDRAPASPVAPVSAQADAAEPSPSETPARGYEARRRRFELRRETRPIRVYLQCLHDEKGRLRPRLRWWCTETSRGRSMSLGTVDRAVAEARRAELESLLRKDPRAADGGRESLWPAPVKETKSSSEPAETIPAIVSEAAARTRRCIAGTRCRRKETREDGDADNDKAKHAYWRGQRKDPSLRLYVLWRASHKCYTARWVDPRDGRQQSHVLTSRNRDDAWREALAVEERLIEDPGALDLTEGAAWDGPPPADDFASCCWEGPFIPSVTVDEMPDELVHALDKVVAQRTAAIRATWSDEEREERCSRGAVPWELPGSAPKAQVERRTRDRSWMTEQMEAA